MNGDTFAGWVDDDGRRPIFVYCDSDRHPGKRVAVMNFTPSEPGRWGDHFPSTARRDGMHTGTILDGENKPWHPSPTGDDDFPRTDLRRRERIECRKCHAPLVVKESKLDAVLNAFTARGLTSVPLALLAASIERIGNDPT